MNVDESKVSTQDRIYYHTEKRAQQMRILKNIIILISSTVVVAVIRTPIVYNPQSFLGSSLDTFSQIKRMQENWAPVITYGYFGLIVLSAINIAFCKREIASIDQWLKKIVQNAEYEADLAKAKRMSAADMRIGQEEKDLIEQNLQKQIKANLKIINQRKRKSRPSGARLN